MKTFIPGKDELKKKWYLIDAEEKILGRLATQIAMILSGKNKPIYTPHLDTGDFVVVINAAKVKVTGRKEEKKIYYYHSGYIGSLRERTLGEMRQRKPEEIIYRAVKGMIPKNKLGRKMLTKLKVYPGEDHLHQAQKPEKIEV